MVHLFECATGRFYPGNDDSSRDFSDDLDVALSAQDPELLYEAVTNAAITACLMKPGETLVLAA